MIRTRTRTRTRFILLALACAACVPASEEAPPTGAFGFTTEPSPATRGEPFTTTDGWTVRIDKVAVQVNVSASPTEQGPEIRYYGSSEGYRFDARRSVQVFARALPAGPAAANINLSSTYLSIGDFDASDYDENIEVIGVAPEDSARFLVQSDVSTSRDGYTSYSGPSMLLVLRAQKGPRVISLDLTLDLYSGYSDGRFVGVVQDDALVTVPLGIAVEALFEDERARVLRFDDFADADADENGVISGQELGAVGFFDTLRTRSTRIFGANSSQ